MNRKNSIIVALFSFLLLLGCTTGNHEYTPDNISGIYPHLAYYNNEGECGTGAVVPWAGRLWVITYGPHEPNGSSDKLYEITPDLQQIIRSESIGGTPANRMIHRESGQLFIGPYAIDTVGNVRTIPYNVMPGRHTGNARHLTDPAGKIYYATMEEGFYEVDVNTLSVNTLYPDANATRPPGSMGQYSPLLPGVHGKGLYSGQGFMYYSNNGEDTQEALSQFDVEAGSLSEWDGENWKLIRRNQFVEITGPGGILGNPNPATDPIWATGWDHKSILLGVREPEKGWTFYRLPKASHTYDGAHGWNTEWPRIRNIGDELSPEYLMTMHGLFWYFPKNFTAASSGGIRPRSAYLKVIGDFARWNNQLVFGCDDSAQKEFLNVRKAKGKIGGPGQSNSNLWFTSFNKPDELGPATAEGAVWAREKVKANECSEPFLFSGWDYRSCWMQNGGSHPVSYTLEVDVQGNNQWTILKTVTLPAGESLHIPFEETDKGEWIRVRTDKDTYTTVSFNYSMKERREQVASNIFAGLSPVGDSNNTGALLYGLGNNRRALGVLTDKGYYEMTEKLELIKKEDTETADFIRTHFAIPKDVVSVEESSVLVVDDKDRRWRLPLGNEAFKEITKEGKLRICREVATERDLFHCMGTFYELPAENADGYAKIRPISSHNYQINDYASYRGMLIMSGIDMEQGKDNPHIIMSDDGKATVWAGAIDDLWELGKPVGYGGPWKDSEVKQGIPSDPYLFGFYEKKELSLSHSYKQSVNITIQFDPTGNGDWMTYRQIAVKPGEVSKYEFPNGFEARWIRFVTDTDTRVTAWLEYR